MSDTLRHGDLLLYTQTGEHFMLLRRGTKDFSDEKEEIVWDILGLESGMEMWEWEFLLEDEVDYRRVA
jgi:hypothetical protein